MALHLITGYAGQEHITSADQGAYNIATYGDGNFVLNRGRKFAQTVLSNNSISISDGEAMMQGRFIKMPFGTSENISIENGTTGTKRNDLICIRYQKSSVNSTESASFVVIKGTKSSSTASDPTYNTGSITDGDDTILDFPLYRVKLDGINIQTVDTLFSVKISMSEYMDNYQLPVASNTQLGGVKIGSGINKASDGTISVAEISKATTSTAGIVKVGDGLNVSDGTISVKKTSNATSWDDSAITSKGVYSAITGGSVTRLTGNTYGGETQGIYLSNGYPVSCKKLKTYSHIIRYKQDEVLIPASSNVYIEFNLASAIGNSINANDVLIVVTGNVVSYSSAKLHANFSSLYYNSDDNNSLYASFNVLNLKSTATSLKYLCFTILYWRN